MSSAILQQKRALDLDALGKGLGSRGVLRATLFGFAQTARVAEALFGS